MKKTKLHARGFLGPIGDDLPSLIPLVFALIVFFYSFTFAWNIFDQKSKDFKDNFTVLDIASTLRGNSYIGGLEKFQENCSKAQSTKEIKFLAGLVPLSVNPLEDPNSTPAPEHFTFNPGNKPLTDDSIFFSIEDSGGQKVLKCTNALGETIPRNYNLMFFPVALERAYLEVKDAAGNKTIFPLSERLNYPGAEERFFVKPMLLVVVTWH